MNRISTDIAVVGGGVIGLAIALRLRADGREVMIIEPNEPGSGASYGNAGTVANYAVIPVGTPSVLRNFLSLLLNPNSPLAIRTSALPTLFPWLARFAYESLPHRYRENAGQIAELVSDASSAWTEFAAEIGASNFLSAKGCLYLYHTRKAFQAACADIELRRSYGVSQELLSASEVLGLEPRLPGFEGGGLFFPKAINLSDPGEVMRLLSAAVKRVGVEFVQTSVTGMSRKQNGLRIAASPYEVHAHTVVIAAGAHSRKLAAEIGDPVQLDTERGYHVEYDMPEPPIERPVCPTAHGFYFCPLRGRLRVAGLVELGGLTAPENPQLLQALARNARRFFPELGAPSRTWLGFRPSMPNSVPVIRPSKGGKDVILAFGHGHIGLTLAPRTARLVSAILTSKGK
ncbi:NAD(P)/FAD-dependent oxidoreductase [Rhizobium paranaense]|uniref:D-amino-acid dehydrogenase n=1 Tax=Rhizobium paranaense TaxID=1650438 RepID=A0A7W9D2U7_9HYPH|nr:FAD-dependent oxidoreductase [Rhizobium paranaense]MBB5575510.1 D-amino-acid dehydrogenase [Rhizobium paranaense]